MKLLLKDWPKAHEGFSPIYVYDVICNITEYFHIDGRRVFIKFEERINNKLPGMLERFIISPIEYYVSEVDKNDLSAQFDAAFHRSSSAGSATQNTNLEDYPRLLRISKTQFMLDVKECDYLTIRERRVFMIPSDSVKMTVKVDNYETSKIMIATIDESDRIPQEILREKLINVEKVFTSRQLASPTVNHPPTVNHLK